MLGEIFRLKKAVHFLLWSRKQISLKYFVTFLLFLWVMLWETVAFYIDSSFLLAWISYEREMDTNWMTIDTACMNHVEIYGIYMFPSKNIFRLYKQRFLRWCKLVLDYCDAGCRSILLINQRRKGWNSVSTDKNIIFHAEYKSSRVWWKIIYSWCTTYFRIKIEHTNPPQTF